MRKILLVLILTFITTYSKSQLVNSLGIKGGISIANQKWKFTDSTYTGFERVNKSGLNFFITADFLKSKIFKLIGDLGYCEKGSQTKVQYTTPELPEGDGSYIYYKDKVNYLSFSLNAKIEYPFKNIIPYLFVGPRIDYQLSYSSDVFYFQSYDEFTKTIFGINYGLGLTYRIKNYGIMIEFNNNKDLTPFLNKEIPLTTERVKVYNKAILVSAGIKYYFLKSE